MSFLSQLNLTNTGSSKMSNAAFEELRQFIYAKTGIYFPDNKKYLLQSRVSQRITALRWNDFSTYIARIKAMSARDELEHLINAITINETFFFRNEPQLEVFKNELMPKIVQNATNAKRRDIRIWSAASSTGEEPYTLAIVLRDKFLAQNATKRFQIFGTDINTDVLESARKANYKKYAIRKVPNGYMSRYFENVGEEYHLKPIIKNMVTYKNVNLFDRAKMRQMNKMDVIFCANVLIYFDTKSKKQVVNALYDSLNPGGFLLLGYSESLYGVSQAFKPVHFSKTIAYQKEL